MATPPHRFVVLDSLRGVCALMVTFVHLNAYSIVKQVPFFVNAYLFVDFFFVLSGFVIATNYQARLGSGFGIQKFMFLRFGRLYPLYLVVLLCFFLVELVFERSGAFSAPHKTFDTALANIFLLQGFYIFSFDTWNWPGWSIATEFWTCFLFALIASLWPRRIIAILVCLSVVSLYFIANYSLTGMNVTYNFGMLRSIIGFSSGAMVFTIWQKTKKYKLDSRIAFVAEMLCVIIVFIFVTVVAQSNYSLIAPFVFAIVVLVFTQESGPISSILRNKVFVVLGLLSYSIYLVHLFIARMLVYAALSIETMSGHLLITKIPHEGELIDVLGVNLTQGNLWVCLYIILVVGLAAITHRYIEVPSRLWFRKQAQIKRPTHPT
jgi:peptidoglycan/LPS O-acetylase OafA/YrhL